MKWLWALPVAGVVVGAIVLLAIRLNGSDELLEVRAAEVSGDPRVLFVTYLGQASACDLPTRVPVEESESTVTLRAWVKKGPGGVCPAKASC